MKKSETFNAPADDVAAEDERTLAAGRGCAGRPRVFGAEVDTEDEREKLLRERAPFLAGQPATDLITGDNIPLCRERR